MKKPSENSRALWNRNEVDLESNEVLAQLLDRGDMADWRHIYCLARTDVSLRRRIKHIILTVPTALPHFWLAALQSLGEPVDWNVRSPDYFIRRLFNIRSGRRLAAAQPLFEQGSCWSGQLEEKSSFGLEHGQQTAQLSVGFVFRKFLGGEQAFICFVGEFVSSFGCSGPNRKR